MLAPSIPPRSRPPLSADKLHDGGMTIDATRAAGLARLADFVPRAGRAYAAERNHDRASPTAHREAETAKAHRG